MTPTVETGVQSGVQTDWITEIDFLNQEECDRTRQALGEMREHWIQRHPVAPFYTLGASNYFDIAYNPILPYYRFAARFNPILMDRLGWLYEKLAQRISAHFGGPVAYRENLALPGFHIFLADHAFENPADLTHMEWFRAKGKKEIVGSAIHCDTAHMVVDWGDRSGLDFENPISITVSIRLPKSGAGLNYWDFGLERTGDMKGAELREFLLSSNKHHFPYSEGGLVIHSGLRYHQMAAMKDMAPDEERITLQGHGVRENGTWQLFW